MGWEQARWAGKQQILYAAASAGRFAAHANSAAAAAAAAVCAVALTPCHTACLN